MARRIVARPQTRGPELLARYPGLTAIAVVALSVAIGGGAAYLEFVNELVRPTLPGRDGQRIVGIQNWDLATGSPDHRSLRHFVRWRETLTSLDLIGAAITLERNLITEDGRSEAARGVEISASAFRLFATPALLGRGLVQDDERLGAPPVVVLGQDLWRARFDSDPAVVGRTVRLGAAAHTVVGVMPAGFGFPLNHSLWLPLRIDASGLQRSDGPSLRVFGRLADGVAIEAAEAELTAIASRDVDDAARAGRMLRPQIKPYVASMWSSIKDGQLQIAILYSVNLFFIALLGVCGANVATLVFARTATREAEITVRTALGASRTRIVGQLFAEALVLASVAAGVGLAAASFGLRWGRTTWLATATGAPAPFWWNDELSTETLFYAGGLALLAAVMVGVVPALKATGPHMQARLKHAAAGGTGMRFGGIWTGVIVTQIALTVLFLLSVVSIGWNLYASGYRSAVTSFPREHFVSVRLEMDRDDSPGASASDAQASYRARFRRTYQELEQRLLAEPGVVGVTYATAFPGLKHGEFFVEIQGFEPPRPAHGPLWVRTATVGANVFATLGVPIIAGRAFTPADEELDRPVAIVDQTFVQEVMGGSDPIGRWVRQPQNSENDAPGPWYEIVGVVRDLSIAEDKTSEDAVLYRPAVTGSTPGLRLAVHVNGDAVAFAPRLRSVAASVDPTLRLYDILRMDQFDEADRLTFQFFLRALAIVSVVALLLSTAGVYSLMSFTVTRRTREIGIRTAVGADRRQILTGIFSRAFSQVGLGIAAGSVPGTLLVAFGAPEVARGSGEAMAAAAFTLVAAFMFSVALLACVGPARRVLRIRPTDALRADS
jgi:putative ABC transport system permease protein